MRNLLALFGALVVTFLIVGYFLGWYSIHSQSAPLGRHNVNIDIDGTKIRQDLDNAGQKVGDWINSKSQTATEKTPDTKSQQRPQASPPSSNQGVVLHPPTESKPAPSGGWWFPK